MKDDAAFIKSHTTIGTTPLVPELRLHLATEITPIWQATESHLAACNVEPPFWAFAWPGSQLIARWILDNPDRVAARRVMDFACGCGLAGAACAKAGAEKVFVNDIDPLALEAAKLNASLNTLSVLPVGGDLTGSSPDVDLLLCGDVCYNQQMADRIIPWLRRCAENIEVWMADPGRPYAPATGIAILACKTLTTSTELEGSTSCYTRLCRILPS